MRTITFAHRGGPLTAGVELPENSLEAFRRALAHGAAGLETDAWLAADGEAVLVHDRTARRGLLRRVRVGDTPSDELARAGIPRLADLYRELGTAFELSVDVKEPAALDAVVGAAVAAGDGAAARLWLCSGDLALLSRARERDGAVHGVQSVRRRAIEGPVERHVADLSEHGVEALNMHWTDWSKGLVSLAHRFGVRAFAWDAQEVRSLRAVLAMGVDAVYCDRVDRMVAVVGEFEAAG